MRVDRAGLEVLARAEALDLLASVGLGRIAISWRAMPMILPVQFRFADDRILVDTWDGSDLSRATDGAVVAFETEGPVVDGHPAWSVLVGGLARHVDGLAAGPRSSWAPDHPPCVVAISTEHVSGRRAHGRWQDVRPWTGPAQQGTIAP